MIQPLKSHISKCHKTPYNILKMISNLTYLQCHKNVINDMHSSEK